MLSPTLTPPSTTETPSKKPKLLAMIPSSSKEDSLKSPLVSHGKKLVWVLKWVQQPSEGSVIKSFSLKISSSMVISSDMIFLITTTSPLTIQ